MNTIISPAVESARLRSLDSLRGIAAIGVAFFYHYSHFNIEYFTAHPDALPWYGALQWFYHNGWNLVDFFFVLSGFIFMHVYYKKIAENRVSEKTFFILRLSRLYPLHIATLLLVAGVQYFRLLSGKGYFDCQYNDLYHFLLNILFLQAGFFNDSFSFNHPSWSLSCEVAAYLIFFYTLKKSKKPALLFILYMFTGISILQMRLNYPLFNPQIARMLMAFFAGCLLFYLNEQIKRLNIRTKRIIFISVILYSMLIIALIMKAGYTAVLGHWERAMPLAVYPLFILLLLNVKLIGNFFTLRPFTFLGDISYSVYLLHFPVQLLMFTFLPIAGIRLDYTRVSSLLIYVSITITTAAASHYLFEKPVQRIIRKKYIKGA